ncbi:hypothetical protein MBLNU457_g0541t1 [Dothideomycetes sp. NU457]
MSDNLYVSEHDSSLAIPLPPRSASRASTRSDLDLDKPLPPLRKSSSEFFTRDEHHLVALPERAATPAFSVRPSRLQNRPSKISLFNLFNRSTLETEMDPSAAASPVMPPLSAVYSQAIKATIAHTSSADETLRHYTPFRSATPLPRNIQDNRGTGEVRRLSKLHVYSRVNISAQRRVFALIAGHLLQYTERGLNDRLPERSLQLTKDSIAVASDLVPGKPYTIQITEAMTVLKANTSSSSTSLFTRMKLRGFNVPMKTQSILMIFNDPTELEDWLRALRREISSMGGPIHSPKASNLEEQVGFNRADSLEPVLSSHRTSIDNSDIVSTSPISQADPSDHAHHRPPLDRFSSEPILHIRNRRKPVARTEKARELKSSSIKVSLDDRLPESSRQSPPLETLLSPLPGTTSDFAVPTSRFSADSGIEINARLKSLIQEPKVQPHGQLRTSNSFSSIRSVRSIIPPTIREVPTPASPKSPKYATRPPMRQLHSRRVSPLPVHSNGKTLYRSSSQTTLQNKPAATSTGRRHSHSTSNERPGPQQPKSVPENSKSSVVQPATFLDSDDETATPSLRKSAAKLSLFPSPPTSPPTTSSATTGLSLIEVASRSKRPVLKRPASYQVRPRPTPITTDVRSVTSSDVRARVGLGITIASNEASATNETFEHVHAQPDDALTLPRLDLGLPVIGLGPPAPPPQMPLPDIPHDRPRTPQLTRNA